MKRFLLASLAAALTLPLNAHAFGPRKPPMVMPKLATASSDATWLVGSRDAKAMRAAGGRRILPGSWEVPAASVRGLRHLTYAEPNRTRRLTQRAVPDDPLTPRSRWRDAAIDPELVPPPISETGPLLALVDSKPSLSHPEFTGANVRSLHGGTIGVSHGTETLGVAVAPQNDIGIVGTYPSARAVNVALPNTRIRCADSARGIRRAVNAGAAIINMSYGAVSFCQTEFQALELAVHHNVVLVAAGGNERTDGNPYEFPASLPHVLTIGALTPKDRAAFFSNTSAALDLVAPGVGIIAPLPKKFDNDDDARDGYEIVSGTSFSAPIVSAAAQWLRTARPELTADQVTQVLRRSAVDIAKRGYDQATGTGKLNLARALGQTAPKPDALEPNEDFRFVDGRAYGEAATPLPDGATLDARMDRFEDPSDVYRVRVPAHSSVTIAVKPRYGNADLDVYRAGSPTVASDRGLLARKRHHGTRRDAATVRNTTGRTRIVLAQTYMGKARTCRYTLSLR